MPQARKLLTKSVWASPPPEGPPGLFSHPAPAWRHTGTLLTLYNYQRTHRNRFCHQPILPVGQLRPTAAGVPWPWASSCQFVSLPCPVTLGPALILLGLLVSCWGPGVRSGTGLSWLVRAGRASAGSKEMGRPRHGGEGPVLCPSSWASPHGWLCLFWREEGRGGEERRRKKWGKRQQPEESLQSQLPVEIWGDWTPLSTPWSNRVVTALPAGIVWEGKGEGHLLPQH